MIELKNPADENATVWSAHQQLQTYQAQIPALFATNVALLVSDGVQARSVRARNGSSLGAPARETEGCFGRRGLYHHSEIFPALTPCLSPRGRGEQCTLSPTLAELLEQAVRKYQNRAIETVQVIEELIQLAKDMRAADARGEALKLNDDELAFYDALEVNDSAVKVLGEPTLVHIARELVETVKKNVTIDWIVRENVRAQLRVIVKRILRKYGYPPDKQEKATQTVLEQAEVLSEMWAVA